MEQKKQEDTFIKACARGNLKTVKYLLTSIKLEQRINIDNNNKQNEGLKIACKNGNLEIVKYLISSPDLKIRSDFHVDNEDCLFLAASEQKRDVVKYLIEQGADIHIENDCLFDLLSLLKDKLLLTYLIDEVKIKLTSSITEILNKNNITYFYSEKQKSIKEELLERFKNRDIIEFQQKLEIDLSKESDVKIKKLKI